MRSVWSHPLKSATGKVLGTFAVYRNVVHHLDEIEIGTIRGAADLVALAIERNQTPTVERIIAAIIELAHALGIRVAGEGVETRYALQRLQELGEFLLPYAAVRTAEDTESFLMSFFESTYEAAAELAHWNRAELEATF